MAKYGEENSDARWLRAKLERQREYETAADSVMRMHACSISVYMYTLYKKKDPVAM